MVALTTLIVIYFKYKNRLTKYNNCKDYKFGLKSYHKNALEGASPVVGLTDVMVGKKKKTIAKYGHNTGVSSSAK